MKGESKSFFKQEKEISFIFLKQNLSPSVLCHILSWPVNEGTLAKHEKNVQPYPFISESRYDN